VDEGMLVHVSQCLRHLADDPISHRFTEVFPAKHLFVELAALNLE